MSKIERGRKTIEAMIALYCKDHHGTDGTLCDECMELRDYAWQRLERCIFGEDKPVCAKCPIHCYKPAMRERVTAVMRYAGPRMVFKHPRMALEHLVDSHKPAPEMKRDRRRSPETQGD